MTDNAVSHPLAARIAKLRLPGMQAAFLEQMARHDLNDMTFEDRLALLIDREIAERRSRALQRRLKKAQLDGKIRHQDACFEDINLSRPRGLDRNLVLGLGDCVWVRNGANDPDHRPLRHRQVLDRVRLRPQGLPRRVPGPVPARAAAAHRSADRPWRGHHTEALPRSRPHRGAHPRRLGPGADRRRAGTRSSSRYSMIASAGARWSPPANSRSPTGTGSSTIPPSPMQSSTVSSTAPPGSSCTARPCAPMMPTLLPSHDRGRPGPRFARQNRRFAPERRSGRTASCDRHGARAPLRLVRGHASRAPHAPPSCRRAFGGGIVEEEIAKGELPTIT